MITQDFTLSNLGGLHARPAVFFVTLCSKYQSDIQVVYQGKKADAKSIIAIMALGAGQGKTVTINAAGIDSEQAMKDISAYLSDLSDK